MAEGYGGAKPKTKTPERNSNKAKCTKGSNSSQTYAMGDMNAPLKRHNVATETCFIKMDKQESSLVKVAEENTISKNNHFQKVDKSAKPKLMKSKTKNVQLRSDLGHCSIENGRSCNGTCSPNGFHGNENLEDQRLHEIGKLSKQKEQEYLSARERWKKSGMALRRYISEKLGFKHEDRANKPFLRDKSDKRQLNGIKRKSESVDFSTTKPTLPRSRSENLKDESVIPRSRSFLRYFGFRKENNSAAKAGLKTSKSLEMSSSDAWPESSTDTCKSTSDWSADNTLTNHSDDSKMWTNQKCQGTQTQIPNKCKCKKGTKAKNRHENNHKPRTHRNSKEQNLKTSKDSTLGNSSKSDKTKLKKEKQAEKLVGILDNEIPSSSEEEEFEFVLDQDYGEIVGRSKSRKPRSSGGNRGSRTSESGSERRSQEISDSTYEALLGLQHAIPYLPENFRNRLQNVQNSSANQSQTTLTTGSLNRVEEVTLDDKKSNLPGERTERKSSEKRSKRELMDQKKSMKDKNNWKKRNDETKLKTVDKQTDSYDMIDDLQKDLEHSLEDPFNIRSDTNIDLCSGLMDFVREIDIPFIDEDGETKFDNLDQERSERQRDLDENCKDSEHRGHFPSHLGVGAIETLGTLDSRYMNMYEQTSRPSGYRPSQFINTGLETTVDGSTETSFEDDPDYPGMRTLNDSFNRLLGDDETDTSTDSSVLHNFLQRSRSNESGSRSKSSDDSIEADDEFECECDHCQLLRQHSYSTNNLDLLPQRLYTEDMGFPYDFDLHSESSASGQAETDSNRGFNSAMFLDDYDLLLDRSNSELDWLIIDSRPLSLMLEDVIQQMLAVQPELLTEQAAPPAPQVVIENLPTIPLTLTHLVQHPSCPICLCLCEIEEVMTLLPCQHIFHPICIQAWLIKSGTCPVCRAKISR